MIKLLVLQQWHGLSNPELERQVTNRISFRKADKDRAIRTELQRQLDSLGLYFGYKLHSKEYTELYLIRKLETTTASVHDNQADLSREGEVVYRDRGYQGAEAHGYSAIMRRDARDHSLGFFDQLRNCRISKKRTPAERHYAMIKCVFYATHILITTVSRVHVKMIFTAFGFNLYQLCTLRRQGAV